jgi:glutaredoxin-dependent peroxiredoxin
MALKTGDTAPNFTLQDSKREKVTLQQLTENGKALILFYPLSFSGTCTGQMCEMRDNMKMFNAFATTVAAISVDSFFVQREFKKANNLKFPLLSDFNREAAGEFGIIYDDFYGLKGVSKRAAYVIDRDLTIKYAEVLEDADQLPDLKAIRKVLSQ